jgi:CoA:oxalate CoA-transferase
MPNTPVKLSRTPGGIQGPSPGVGQDTDTVLARLLGLSQPEIAVLHQDGTVL